MRAIKCCIGKPSSQNSQPPRNGASREAEVDDSDSRRKARLSRVSASWAAVVGDVDTILGRLEKLDDERQDLQRQLQQLQASSWGAWAEDMAVQAELERLQQELTPT